MTRISVTSLRGNYESSTTSHCHKKIMNKDFGLLFFKLGQVFVQDFSKITSGLNMNIYFWPIILSLPTVGWLDDEDNICMMKIMMKMAIAIIVMMQLLLLPLLQTSRCLDSSISS